MVSKQLSWTLERRYNEFHALYNTLKKLHEYEDIEFPPKKWFKKMDLDTIEERKNLLQVYLRILFSFLESSSLLCNLSLSLCRSFYSLSLSLSVALI